MKKAFALLLLMLTLVLPAMAEEGGYTKYSTSFFGTFDTIVIVQGYALEEATFTQAAQTVHAQFVRYHEVFDKYTPYEGVNNLYHLNREGPKGDPVAVEPELMDLLLYCKERQPQMAGRFNVAMGAVLGLWHDYRDSGTADPENAKLPPMEKLREAAGHVDFDKVLLNPEAGTVTFLDPALQLDVGAVAKGYTTEAAGQWMLQSAVPSFLISAGGNVRVGQPPMDGRQRWGISIQDPDGSVLTGANEDILDVLFLSNGSVVTSGDYQRFYVVDGERYHHIIDPDTLMPADYFRSVTVVCEDSGLADMLSTTLFLLPYEEGLAFVEGMDGVECFWMLKEGDILMTDGMRAMSRAEGASSRD